MSLYPIASLQWIFKRPCSDGSRTSGYFGMLGDRWCLLVSLAKRQTSSDFCVRLQSRTGKRAPDPTLAVACHFMARGRFHGYNHRCTGVSSDQMIFHTSLDDAEIFPKEEEELWTVFCMFSCNNPLSLQLAIGTVHLSTVDGGIAPNTVDEGVQASSQFPKDTEALSCDMSSLYEDGLFPDFKLKCGGRTFPVHRSVLAARSRTFRSMFLNARRESEPGSADVDDLEAPVLELLLKFLYSGKLETEDRVAGLYDAAHRYGVRSLVAACSESMKNLSLENCVLHLQVSVSHSDPDLKDAAVSFILSHPSVFKSAAWEIFLKDHMAVASDVLQTYASRGRKRSSSVKQEPSASRGRKRGSNVKQEPSAKKARRTQSSDRR